MMTTTHNEMRGRTKFSITQTHDENKVRQDELTRTVITTQLCETDLFFHVVFVYVCVVSCFLFSHFKHLPAETKPLPTVKLSGRKITTNEIKDVTRREKKAEKI